MYYVSLCRCMRNTFVLCLEQNLAFILLSHPSLLLCNLYAMKSFSHSRERERERKALKKWAGVARSSNTSILFLPAKNSGLALPSLVRLYKNMHATMMVQLFRSSDPAVRNSSQRGEGEAEVEVQASSSVLYQDNPQPCQGLQDRGSRSG